MKTLTTLIVALSLVVTTTVAQAQQNGVDGFILGAGGGALIGQAIGRNTEATLIGTAVGSMLGYMIGNERDKNGVANQVSYRTPVRQYPQTRYVTVVPAPQTEPEPICRETEMLAEIDGRPEKVYGTACLQNGEWILDRSELVTQTVIIGSKKHRNFKRNSHYKRANHRASRHFNRPADYRHEW
nr:glycine zipper 2TM domain-containing protein [Desulfobulbaceae bacterium]